MDVGKRWKSDHDYYFILALDENPDLNTGFLYSNFRISAFLCVPLTLTLLKNRPPHHEIPNSHKKRKGKRVKNRTKTKLKMKMKLNLMLKKMKRKKKVPSGRRPLDPSPPFCFHLLTNTARPTARPCSISHQTSKTNPPQTQLPHSTSIFHTVHSASLSHLLASSLELSSNPARTRGYENPHKGFLCPPIPPFPLKPSSPTSEKSDK